MVNLVEDWEVLLEYAGDKLGFFQVLEFEGSTEIRVQVGRLGFKKEFITDNPDVKNIVELCKIRGYIEIKCRVRDEDFFK